MSAIWLLPVVTAHALAARVDSKVPARAAHGGVSTWTGKNYRTCWISTVWSRMAKFPPEIARTLGNFSVEIGPERTFPTANSIVCDGLKGLSIKDCFSCQLNHPREKTIPKQIHMNRNLCEYFSTTECAYIIYDRLRVSVIPHFATSIFLFTMQSGLLSLYFSASSSYNNAFMTYNNAFMTSDVM